MILGITEKDYNAIKSLYRNGEKKTAIARIEELLKRFFNQETEQ